MRKIPVAMQEHLDQPATSTTRIIKIMLRSGLSYGLAMLDRNIHYDDGFGPLDYVATNGFDPSMLSADVGYSVDNAEGFALISDGVPGVTIEMAEAGELDDARWVCYLVDFLDLGRGHIILDAGDVGEIRTRYGMIWIPEFLSYVMRLKQPVGSVWSRQCRAIFGSQANSQTGCGVALGPLWAAGVVTAVGVETDREFEGDVLMGGHGIAPNPGRLQWLSGANVGREFSIEDADTDTGYVSLNETTPHPIQPGDVYRIRPDCRKRYIEDCIGIWLNGPNFKGEPLIPVGDAAAIQTPGAQGGGGGGSDVVHHIN